MLDNVAKVPLQRHPDSTLLPIAFDLANRTFRSLYDCLYLALAIGLQGRLVTADRKLFDALAGTPVADCLCWVESLP